MKDSSCIDFDFLKWALPRLQMRWPGFRKVHRTICKRLRRRMIELELPTTDSYRAFLEAHPTEWLMLDKLCRVTISRFYRDVPVFDFLGQEVLPLLAERVIDAGEELRCWSAGCASGEEPYTLDLIFKHCLMPKFPKLGHHILATDADTHLLERARKACYPSGSLKDLPDGLMASFVEREGLFCLEKVPQHEVTFSQQDIRTELPHGPFHLILCRNLVLTYFSAALQRQVLAGIIERLIPQGVLVIGKAELLPEGVADIVPLEESLRVFCKPGHRLAGDAATIRTKHLQA
jgi:chemotaxis protein methyltransferase CheR